MTNENKNKKFYWIKLKDTFFTSDTIDFLMSQKDGANYIVLYQMLCLKAVNTDGVLARQLGEVIIPFDVEKIQRDCKYFSADTIRVALELYTKLGLMFVMDNGLMRINNFENMVGSTTQGAIEKKQYRDRQCLSQCPDKCLSRDKEIKILDIDTKEESIKKKGASTTPTFVKPTLEEVKSYCEERHNHVNAERFIDFYESKGWMVGKNKMKNWKACVRTWEQRDNQQPSSCDFNISDKHYSEQELEANMSSLEDLGDLVNGI